MKKLVLSLVIAICAPALWAEDLTGKGEASIFGGGIHVNNGGNHGIWGGNIGYGVGSKTTIFGEVSHSPLNGGADLVDYNGGVKFTLMSRNKFEPYALIAAGANRVSGTSDFGLHAGGGARLYVGSRWGIQPEIRWTRYFNDFSDTNLVRYTGGIFFQWGK